MEAMTPLDKLRGALDIIGMPSEGMPLSDEIKAYLDSSEAQNHISAIKHSLDFFECAQDPIELQQMLVLIRGKHSLLEVGSRLGGTLLKMARVLAPQSLVVSVDFPGVDGTPELINPEKNLRANCEKIAWLGHRVELILGDSHMSGIVEKAASFAPFDFGFIDGDHRYEGVKADWENYGPMCKVVGFHDIAGNEDGCVRLWQELKAQHRHQELIYPNGPHSLGIGLIFQDK